MIAQMIVNTLPCLLWPRRSRGHHPIVTPPRPGRWPG
jgi:hypothetical protein